MITFQCRGKATRYNNNLYKQKSFLKAMNKWTEILVGLVLIVVAVLVWAYSSSWMIGPVSFDFGAAAWDFLKGGVIWFVIMIGLLFLLLGISDLRE
jgi:hypothetical protein